MRKMKGITLYGAKELGAAVGVCESTVYYWLKGGRIPEPYKIGAHSLWDGKDLQNIKRDLASGRLYRRGEGGVLLVGKSAFAKMCGKHGNQIRRLVSLGVIPPPSHVAGNRTLPQYTEEEAHRFAALVAAYQPPPPQPRCGRKGGNIRVTEVRERGYYNKTHAADYLDMPVVTFKDMITRGILPQPKHKVKGILCYKRSELDDFRITFLAPYFETRDAK